MAKFINRKSLRILEYDKILASIANYTSSSYAKSTVMSIKPSVEIQDAKYKMNLTAQAFEILYEHLVSPSFSLDEMEEILENSKKFVTLSCAYLIRVG